MKHLVHILVVFLVMAFGFPDDILPSMEHAEAVEYAQTLHQLFKERKTKDGLRNVNTYEHKHAEAIRADVHLIYQICNSRPQRILSYGSKNNRLQGKSFGLVSYKNTKTCCSERAYRKPTLPFLPEVSCDYYVIALRRILC